MAQLVYPIDADTLLADVDAARSMAKNYAGAYQSASPYPHICIDNFLPEQVLENVLTDLHQEPVLCAEFAALHPVPGGDDRDRRIDPRSVLFRRRRP
ncbi:hypothetical protein [Neorhizobium galegae]|uniref:hypothetical protein n=1 Tax=Neorhizobium galegae TaxID=399 RepID=UPI001AEDB25D|nr:hypothetical protein [Neorhizobium galegae]